MRRSLLTLSLLIALPLVAKKEFSVSPTNESIELDGLLRESIWKTSVPVQNFIQNTPKAGEAASRQTEVFMSYDNAAIYIGAKMYDERDSMSLTLSQRDDVGNADFFGVIFDPYNAGNIGFSFVVTSAGVQVDELHNTNDQDKNWNAVWQSAVFVGQGYWSVEMRIPFSAIRFPKVSEQQWGINFMRTIRRHRETSHWNYYDPKGVNLISQLGEVDGIVNVETPVRLSLSPYISGYVENFNGSTGYSANGGADIKYGLNDAFTLDMTLIPDFGQVQFDQQVLNLSPFEVQFNENRQFFTEGTELFNKAGLFYSRRVGGRPINRGEASNQLEENEVIEELPDVTQLFNASKLSGRTKSGLGIGFFNAVTAVTDATLRDTMTGAERPVEIGPLSNYNVFVLDQNLKNNSSVTLTNTNVWRSGYTYDSNVTALGTNLFTKGQLYNAAASMAVSQKYYETQSVFGYKLNSGIGKSSGNFQWRLGYSELNDTYDQNDLGFQTINNTRTASLRLNYNYFKPFWRLYRIRTSAGASYGRIVSPNAFSDFSINMSANGTFRNFMTAGFGFNGAPVRNLNWFEPRTPNRFYENDQYFRGNGFISSDYSKPFALDMNTDFTVFNDVNRYNVSLSVSPRFRLNDQVMLILRSAWLENRNEEGAALTASFILPYEGEDPIFAKRDRKTITNTISADYIFTNRMGLTFSLRHYWSEVDYNEFFRLDENGRFSDTEYNGIDEVGNSLHNNRYNAFTIDMVYRWVFAPGSEINLVWKNSIFSFDGVVGENYFENVNSMVQNPTTNGLSFKLIYIIDYWETKERLKG